MNVSGVVWCMLSCRPLALAYVLPSAHQISITNHSIQAHIQPRVIRPPFVMVDSMAKLGTLYVTAVSNTIIRGHTAYVTT
jgi:hypothetical protein